MEDQETNDLALDIAKRLQSIKQKESAIEEKLEEVDKAQGRISILMEEVQKLRQEIASERYVISEKLGKPEKSKE